MFMKVIFIKGRLTKLGEKEVNKIRREIGKGNC